MVNFLYLSDVIFDNSVEMECFVNIRICEIMLKSWNAEVTDDLS